MASRSMGNTLRCGCRVQPSESQDLQRLLSSRRREADVCYGEDAQQLRQEPPQADATRGRTALQSVRELVGDSRSENHNLRVDRFQGVRSVWSRARRCRPGEARPARTARIAPPTRGGGAHTALLSAFRAPLHPASTGGVDLRRVARLRPSFARSRICSAVRTALCLCVNGRSTIGALDDGHGGPPSLDTATLHPANGTRSGRREGGCFSGALQRSRPPDLTGHRFGDFAHTHRTSGHTRL